MSSTAGGAAGAGVGVGARWLSSDDLSWLFFSAASSAPGSAVGGPAGGSNPAATSTAGTAAGAPAGSGFTACGAPCSGAPAGLAWPGYTLPQGAQGTNRHSAAKALAATAGRPLSWRKAKVLSSTSPGPQAWVGPAPQTSTTAAEIGGEPAGAGLAIDDGVGMDTLGSAPVTLAFTVPQRSASVHLTLTHLHRTHDP
jgi:hypothetical protein